MNSPIFFTRNKRCELYAGSPGDRLRAGRRLYALISERLPGDSDITRGVAILTDHAEALANHMRAIGLGETCRRCAARPGGGCCSSFMAGETDGVQIALNMLAGIDVQPVNEGGEECCYLSADGCLFLFKPMFCLNYNCRQIIASATPAEIALLELLTGTTLQQQHLLEQRLLGELTTGR